MPSNPISPQASGHKLERSEPSKQKSTLDGNSKPNTIDDDRQSPKNPSLGSKKTRPKIHYSAPNLTEQTLLASPFASRASSPVVSESSGNAASRADRDGNTRSGLSAPNSVKKRGQGRTEVYVDLKILSRSSQQSKLVKKERNWQSSSAHNSPEKLGRAKPLSAELFYQKIRPDDENNYPWKDRRPSAPSKLQRPPKQVAMARISSRTAGKTEVKSDKAHTQKHSILAYGASPVQPLEDFQVFNDDFEFDLIDNHDPISWMLPHATDFNRPPSQLSMIGVFLSPGDEGDEGVKKPTDGLDRNSPKGGFDGAWVTSTPFKEVLARKQGFSVVPNLLQGEDDAVVDKKHPHRDFTGANGRASLEGDEIIETDDPLQDHTPWITDSIISPPTEYLQTKGKEADAAPTSGRDRRDGNEDDVKAIHQENDVPNPLLHVYASENVGSPDLAIQIRRMDDDEECCHSGDVDAAPHTAVMVEPRRTRSGTILASQPGTIVGLSSTSIGRTRSGTVTSNGGNSKQPLPLAGVRRTRNGTIIGPLPDLTRSGSGGGRKPDDIIKVPAQKTGPPREGDLDDLDDVQGDSNSVGSTTTSPSRMDQAVSGLEWTLEEADEVEFYADSLFVPRLSSPDPIDFLRFANAKGDKGAMDGMVVSCHVGGGPVNELQWCVADEPPSPEVTRNKTYFTPCVGRTGKGILAKGTRSSRRVKAKGKGKCLTRFMGAHGQVENLTREDDSALQLEDGESDDELLLVEGQSLTLFS